MGYLRRTSYATEWRPLPFESLSGHRKHEVHYWLATGRAFGHKISAPIPLYWAWNAQEQKCVCVHCSVPVAYQVCVYTVLCKMPVFFSCKWNNKTLVQTTVVIGKTSMTHRYIQSVTCTHHNQFKRHDSTISHWMLNRPDHLHDIMTATTTHVFCGTSALLQQQSASTAIISDMQRMTWTSNNLNKVPKAPMSKT